MRQLNRLCHSRAGGNPFLAAHTVGARMDSRLRGNDKRLKLTPMSESWNDTKELNLTGF